MLGLVLETDAKKLGYTEYEMNFKLLALVV